jgi:DNA-binding winged helix-turn-helix (wHTH) protein
MDYRFGDYSLDTERYELRRARTLVKLRPKVFEVLAYLIAQRGRLVSKQELLEQLWPQQFVGEAALAGMAGSRSLASVEHGWQWQLSHHRLIPTIRRWVHSRHMNSAAPGRSCPLPMSSS